MKDNKVKISVTYNKIQNLTKENKALLLERKKLKKELELEKVKAIAFSTMIDIAEKELKIKIRKKSSTKLLN